MESSTPNDPQVAEDETLLRAKINLETGRIAWRALQGFFAAGDVLVVRPGVDLVEVAVQMSQDNRDRVAAWLESGELRPVDDAQALAWYEAEAEVWAVVVKPFVLVQDLAGR
ncbi:MAG: DUF2288 domain-containing protein [Gammaproteobacteria bacterium]|nr:DUF2288 domain-containing protein [Gammaproteobacteria bacterium]